MKELPLHPCVLCFGRIGDLVMLTGMLRLLQARYGRGCYVVGAGSWARAVLHAVPGVEACWALPRHAPFMLGRDLFPVIAALRRSAPGPVVVCEHDPLQRPRIERLLTVSGVDERRIIRLDVPAPGQHRVDCLERLGMRTPPVLAADAYPVPLAPPDAWAPRLIVTPQEEAARDAWLAGRGFSGKPLVLIQPGNHRSMCVRRGRWRRRGTDDKAWPLPRWAELLGKVHVGLPQAAILLLGAPAEVPLLRQIRQLAGIPAVAVASLPLRSTFALCSAAHSMISIDTGPAHAAAALGTPVVVLFGAMPASEWGPRSSCGAPVLHLGGPPASAHVREIGVQTVLEAWCRLVPMREPSAQARAAALPLQSVPDLVPDLVPERAAQG